MIIGQNHTMAGFGSIGLRQIVRSRRYRLSRCDWRLADPRFTRYELIDLLFGPSALVHILLHGTVGEFVRLAS